MEPDATRSLTLAFPVFSVFSASEVFAFPTVAAILSRDIMRHHPFALAPDLVERDRARHSGVERANISTHWQVDQHVAMLARQPAYALALVPDHQGDWPLQVRLVEPRLGAAIQPDTPQPALLQVIQRSGNVRDPRHRQKLHRARRGFVYRRRQPSGAMLGNDHAMRASRLSG